MFNGIGIWPVANYLLLVWPDFQNVSNQRDGNIHTCKKAIDDVTQKICSNFMISKIEKISNPKWEWIVSLDKHRHLSLFFGASNEHLA